jgi:hypothetical protein
MKDLLISGGNAKLGEIPSWSLPPKVTCPGKTDFCNRFCYGLRGNFVHRNVSRTLEVNLGESSTEDWPRRMVNQIKAQGTKVFRIHTVGDFYSPSYVSSWASIVDSLPSVRFYGYTRSWRAAPALRKALVALKRRPNVVLFASTDFTINNERPSGWNYVTVLGPGEPCPHDHHQVATCLECGRCWGDHPKSMSLKLRHRRMWVNISPKLL